jgi:hypothetical protein
MSIVVSDAISRFCLEYHSRVVAVDVLVRRVRHLIVGL